ncbi:MAG: rhodanese-like domain-containing protein [Spirosomataceae bacterium]
MKLLSVVFVCLLAMSATKAQSTLSPQDYVAKLKSLPKAQLVDVRTPEEFNNGHIQAAKLVNYNGPDFKEEAAKLDKNKPVFVYCAAGMRSSKAAKVLTELGFKEVYNLSGGYRDLISQGLK